MSTDVLVKVGVVIAVAVAVTRTVTAESVVACGTIPPRQEHAEE
jgi:hypothetical protein